MSLENVQPIQYLDKGGDSSYLSSVGVERDLAKQMAADFASQERSIFVSILRVDMDDDDHVLSTPDERWFYARNSNFDILTRSDAAVVLTHSEQSKELAKLLGIDSFLKLSMNGTSFFFDDDGNFAKVSDKPTPNSDGEFVVTDYNVYFRQQMSAGDFESVGMMLAAMRIGIEPLRTD